MTPRILVVDDDPHILEVLGMRLESMAYDVTVTADPEQAARLVGERDFDLALFDLRMEPFDGVALMERTHAAQARLPVLIMTAHGTIQSAVQAIKQGAFDFLTKPFVPEELSSKLRRALAERRWAKDLVLLRSVGETLASSDPKDVLPVVTQATMDATETEHAVLFLREDRRIRARATAGASPIPVGRLAAAAEHAIQTRPAGVVRDDVDGRPILAAPLVVAGVPTGALVVASRRSVVPTDDDRELLALFASQAAVAIRNSAELARLRGGTLEALGRVATQVAHEINNPLGGLKLYAHMVEDRFAKAQDTQGAEFGRRMSRAVDRLSAIVKDITAYGRPPELRREPTDVNAALRESLALVQDRIDEKQVRVVTELDPTLEAVALDPRELDRALMNLIVNAIDALDPEGTLRLATRRDADAVEIDVEDTGCGMNAETLARMYELFFTTKPNGTGLGMAIARAVVERHGGRLAIESEPGRGTRCRLSLPA